MMRRIVIATMLAAAVLTITSDGADGIALLARIAAVVSITLICLIIDKRSAAAALFATTFSIAWAMYGTVVVSGEPEIRSTVIHAIQGWIVGVIAFQLFYRGLQPIDQ